MARKKRIEVKLSYPKGRPIQLRYWCPVENRDIRISTGTTNEAEAEEQRAEREAQLLLGIKLRKGDPTTIVGPQMNWQRFREEYTSIQLSTLGSKCHAESRLDIAERILKPRRLGDVANSDALHRLQSKLLQGAESANNRPRSPHTVKSNMAAVLAALNWARLQGWLDEVPVFKKVKTGKIRAMKGRPITGEEFERLLDKVETGLLVVPQYDKAPRKNAPQRKYKRRGISLEEYREKRQNISARVAPSWRYVLRGLWESALRLDELMHMAWDKPGYIVPEWKRGGHPVLHIPSAMQKNDTEEEIPLLPGFERLLLETPEDQRHGWVFNPLPLTLSKAKQDQRPNAEWVGEIISRIGKAAGIIVHPGDEHTSRPKKFVSAHDLRRSCAERLLAAGVPPMTIARVMRHASWETTRRHYAPGDVQRDAGILRQLLTS
jgi:integrase